MIITSARGNHDNVVTYEHICDTPEDMKKINPECITLGSVAIVLRSDDGVVMYMAASDKEWIRL